MPAEGRKRNGRMPAAPAWPLSSASKRERELWNRLWKLPQAVMWERLQQDLEVALYVRRLVEAESRQSPVNLSTLVRQMADSLGLTTPGLRSNRWRIAADEVAAQRQKASPARKSSRDRLKVVAGGSGGA